MNNTDLNTLNRIMRNSYLHYIALIGALAFSGAVAAQSVVLSEAEYDQLKAAGNLPANARPETSPIPAGMVPQLDASRGGGVGNNACDCWVEPDASYTLALGPNDDGSSGLINLPFQFSLYGDLYSSVYVNNNGNISFQQSFATYSASGFPNNTNRMVAPFWADVDTRGNGGQVLYKVTPTAMYVNWVGVGYYNTQTDKRNSFQVIITNGQDPVVGVGSNVSFCYLDMQWTTGSASQGNNGFGGIAATVGANRALNSGDYIQFGRFNVNSAVYDGPFGNNDGINWLDDKNFVFNTAVSTQNIPPIATGQFICDTLRACVGQVSELDVTFLAPENNQTVTSTSSAPTLPSWVETSNSTGIFSTIAGQFTATLADVGFHTIILEGTDDGSPNLTTTVGIVVEIIDIPMDPLVITGNSAICAGQSMVLTATPGYGNYTWSTGQTGSSITITGPGTYTVNSAAGLCQFSSPPFTVTQVQAPPLVITGPPVYCGTPLPTLTATAGWDAYTWSNGSTTGSIEAEGGLYSVTGSFQGCEVTSAPFTLTENDPGPPVITGASQYCEGDNVTLTTTATPYTSLEWSSGQTAASIIATEGTYTVSASYLNCDYVSEPFVVEEVVLPEVVITGDANYCQGSLASITATAGFDVYTWSNGGTGQNISVPAGTYFVTASIGPCLTSSVTFVVTESPVPSPVITGPTVGCAGIPLVLSTTEPYTSYAWSNNVSTATNSVLSGTYTVTVTNEFGCTGTSAAHTVVVDENPTANFSTDPVSPQLPGTTVGFTDLSNGNGGSITSWNWDLGAPGAQTNAQNPSWTYGTPGIYPVTLIVTTANGCTDSLTMEYIIRPAEITIYNVFSPNGDGNNDQFHIENIEFYQNQVTVLNRWGQVLLDAKNYRNTWRAPDVPDGTYFYVITLEDGREFKGNVTILRTY